MRYLKIIGLSLALWGFASVAGADTLKLVQDRGYVQCGVTTGFPGFSAPDDKGEWRGLDVDLCRAIAAATLGDASRIKAVPLNAQQRFTALQSGEIDVLTRNTSVTLQRDTALGAMHAGINFYDGQGFLIAKELGVESATELDGATICLQTGTTTENTLADWARANNIQYTPVAIEQYNEVVNAFIAGRCDVFSTDTSGLASLRVSKLSDPEAYKVLPEIISKEPLGPYVRQGDDRWFNVVRWAHQAMLGAEELGLTSANVDEHLESSSPLVRRFLGVDPGAEKGLGLDPSWAYNIVKQVGNYGESFERNVGQESPLKIERGLNALWTDGGLMYPLPIR
ncbi:MAG TPA: amino acid ABC transporter substrate-binding protein [Burkholderiaceae bacterium]|nr:amino acid ABC transporter substrate-binding protein [Burkholderiaceae bacterium]